MALFFGKCDCPFISKAEWLEDTSFNSAKLVAHHLYTIQLLHKDLISSIFGCFVIHQYWNTYNKARLASSCILSALKFCKSIAPAALHCEATKVSRWLVFIVMRQKCRPGWAQFVKRRKIVVQVNCSLHSATVSRTSAYGALFSYHYFFMM
jgi:hypothetical protein